MTKAGQIFAIKGARSRVLHPYWAVVCWAEWKSCDYPITLRHLPVMREHTLVYRARSRDAEFTEILFTMEHPVRDGPCSQHHTECPVDRVVERVLSEF